jgi:hypothetical protein
VPVIPHGSRAWSTTRQQVFDRRVQDLGQKPEVVRCWEAFSTLPPKDRSFRDTDTGGDGVSSELGERTRTSSG